MLMSEYLWRFYWDCGRSGDLEGLFVATEEEVNELIGKYCSFGEVLGKHSDVYGTIDKGDITKMNVSPDAVAEVSKFLGDNWSGFDPREYAYKQCENISEDGERCEEESHPDELSYHEDKYYCWDCYKKLGVE